MEIEIEYTPSFLGAYDANVEVTVEGFGTISDIHITEKDNELIIWFPESTEILLEEGLKDKIRNRIKEKYRIKEYVVKDKDVDANFRGKDMYEALNFIEDGLYNGNTMVVSVEEVE